MLMAAGIAGLNRKARSARFSRRNGSGHGGPHNNHRRSKWAKSLNLKSQKATRTYLLPVYGTGGKSATFTLPITD
jgi:hypothetical protein